MHHAQVTKQDVPAPGRERIKDLLATGHTPREIAQLLGLSTQRVYAAMEALKRESGKAS